jgi:hypothetical protein
VRGPESGRKRVFFILNTFSRMKGRKKVIKRFKMLMLGYSLRIFSLILDVLFGQIPKPRIKKAKGKSCEKKGILKLEGKAKLFESERVARAKKGEGKRGKKICIFAFSGLFLKARGV